MADKGTISTLSIWSDDQKEVVAMFCAGMTQDEIAAELGVSQSTVARRLASAVEDVRIIRDDGFDVIEEIPTPDAYLPPSRMCTRVDGHR